MKIKIDRSKWLRGEGTDKSFLLRESDGKQCCVGLMLSAAGIEDILIANIRSANILVGKVSMPAELEWLFAVSPIPRPVTRAYVTNDDPSIADSEREALLTDLCQKNGVELEFEN